MTIYDVIEDMAPQFNETFLACQWQGKVDDCTKYIVPVFTEDGFCFSFNALNAHDIFTEEYISFFKNKW